MATLTNLDGTDYCDTLTYNTSSKEYHAGRGNDTIKITGGSGIVVYADSGNNVITITGGNEHTIRIAATDADSDKQNGVDKLIVNGANQIEGHLGSGKDELTLLYTDGKKANGALSQLHGGAWGDSFTVGNGAKGYQLYGDAGNDTFTIKNGSNIVCWGGAANDTFNVTGGTGIKLRGGDSADEYNISAASVDMQLGYGNDVVNVTAGNKQKIKANLGINTINLKAGNGHIITSDIDQAASKKQGYTDAQIKAGQGVGYGVDKIYISDSATQVTANLGDGKDEVTVSSGSGHKIYTEGWGDTVNISGSTSDSYFDAGDGDDIINLSGGINNTITGGAGNTTFNLSGGINNTINNASTRDGIYFDESILEEGQSLIEDLLRTDNGYRIKLEKATVGLRKEVPEETDPYHIASLNLVNYIGYRDYATGEVDDRYEKVINYNGNEYFVTSQQQLLVDDGRRLSGDLIGGNAKFTKFHFGNWALAACRNEVVVNRGQAEMVYGAKAQEGTMDNMLNHNYVEIGRQGEATTVYGAYSEKGRASGNNVRIFGYAENIYGGYIKYDSSWGSYVIPDTLRATYNYVFVSTTSTDPIKNICGGYSASGSANHNMVAFQYGSLDGYIYGGYSLYGDANSNILQLDYGQSHKDSFNCSIYGGYTRTGSACNNEVILNNGSYNGVIIGGYVYSDNKAKDNRVSGNNVLIHCGKIDLIYGGETGSSNSVTVENNVVYMDGGDVGATATAVYAGKTGRHCTGNIINNSITLNSGTATSLYGGVCGSEYMEGNDSTGDVLNNTITMTGGTANNITAALTPKGAARNNKIILRGQAEVKYSVKLGSATICENNQLYILEDAALGTGNLTKKDSALGTDGNDLIFVGSSHEVGVDAGAGNDLIYIKSQNNSLKGGAGLDTYILDWTHANGNTITDDNQAKNLLQIANGQGLSLKRTPDQLILMDGKQSLTLSSPQAIATLELLGTNSKTTYDLTAALAQLDKETLSFATDLAAFSNTTSLTEEDRQHLTVLAGNIE